jgi:dTDP-4-dehydrorhamnose 3,5-epimerase
MRWRQGSIDGVRVETPKANEDQRGWLAEAWRSDRGPYRPRMAYVSWTHPGVTRGPHEHVRQTDYFVFLGAFELRLWDARKGSRTYGVRDDRTLTAPTVVVVPPGVVHAYRCGAVPGMVLNMPDRLYAGKDKRGKVDEIRHENDATGRYRWGPSRGCGAAGARGAGR